KPRNLVTRLVWQSVARCVRNVHSGSSRLDHSFNNSSQVVIIGAAGILCIEFHIVCKFSGPFYALNGPLQDLLPCRIEFCFDVIVRSADPSVYSWLGSVL